MYTAINSTFLKFYLPGKFPSLKEDRALTEIYFKQRKQFSQ